MPHVIPGTTRNPNRHSGVGRKKDWVAALLWLSSVHP